MTRSVFIGFLVFILLVLVGWFGAWKYYQKWSALNYEANALDQTLAQEQEAVQTLKALEEAVRSRQAQVAKLAIAIPPKRDIASVIAAFEEAAATNGLSLVRMSITEPETSASRGRGAVAQPATVFKTFNVTLDLTGRYGSFRTFLQALESSFPLMDTSRLDFQLPVDDDGSLIADPVLEYRLNVETYYLEQ